MAVGHRANELSSRGLWRRMPLIALDLSKGKLVDQFLPPNLRHDNDINDPLSNLGAALGSFASRGRA